MAGLHPFRHPSAPPDRAQEDRTARGHVAARAMGMNDAVWARHANPWSGLTRIPILPCLAFAVYARTWVGLWCLVPIALIVMWAFINPRVFPAPRTTAHWMSRAVLGERVWMNRTETPIPGHHARAAQLLQLTALLGLPLTVYGLVVLDGTATALGVTVTLLAKLWFLDRMVWLYSDMKDVTPRYAAWDR